MEKNKKHEDEGTVILAARVGRDLVEKIKEIAEEETRNLGNMVHVLLREALKARGKETRSIFLSRFEYGEPEKDAPYRLYIYGRDGYHSGRQWFRNKPQLEEEITTEEARKRVKQAIAEKKEVQITNSGDMLVFHASYGVVLYPEPLNDFWEKL